MDKVKTAAPVRKTGVPVDGREFAEYVDITDEDVKKVGLAEAVTRAAELAGSRALSRVVFESCLAGYAVHHTLSFTLTFHDGDGNKITQADATYPSAAGMLKRKDHTARLNCFTVISPKPAKYIDEAGKLRDYPRLATEPR